MAQKVLFRYFGDLLLLALLVGIEKDCLAAYNCPSRGSVDFCRFEGRKALCKTTDVHRLGELVNKDKTSVKIVDLSCNEITNITKASFNSFTNLHTISLAYNMIKVLPYDVFRGLDNLTVLNLTKNPLTSFSGNITGLLPSLSIIDVTGIPHWKPNRELFQLRMLTRIIGWSYSRGCTNCLLYRSNSTTLFKALFITRLRCDSYTKKVDNRSHIVNALNNTRFKFRCKNSDLCLRSQYKTIDHQNDCWSTALLAINYQSVLGYLAIIFNMVAFLTIITCKRLRNNTSMPLVCNMALSDFIMGVYIVVITIYLNSYQYIRWHDVSHIYCWRIGPLWLLGQSGSILTTFILTLERYIAIVYATRPDVRMTGRMAVILIAAFWLIAMFLVGYALYFDIYKFTYYCIPINTNYNKRKSNAFLFTVVIGSLGLFFYLMCFLFYIHIYIAAKRAANDAGVKRESKLAKKIALIVFTNIAFFFLPVSLVGLAVFIFKERFNSAIVSFSIHLRYYLANVFPVTCLCINSFFNPILYAFRHDSFKKVVKERFSLIYDNLISPTVGRMRSAYFIAISTQSSSNNVTVPSLPVQPTAKVNPILETNMATLR